MAHEVELSSPDSQAIILRPSTKNNLAENAKLLGLSLRFLQFSGSLQKPLVIMAHSRGAAEILLTIMKQPSLIDQLKIKQIVLVQGAFAGTPLAEVTFSQWQRICLTKGLEFRSNIFCQYTKPFMKSVSDLKPLQTRKIFSDAKSKLSETSLAKINKTVSFVTSESSFWKTHKALIPGKIYINMKAGKNDGVIPSASHYLPGVGTRLFHASSDHLSLIEQNKYSPKVGASFFDRVLEALLMRGRF